MILTVTPNVALDRTYVVARLEPGTVHKVQRSFAQVGGKGVNVSRTVAALGRPTLVTGLFGRSGVAAAAEELREAGIDSDLVGVAGPARQTVTVVDGGGAITAFDEGGPGITPEDWEALVARVAGLLSAPGLVVLAGSLPPGAPETGYRQLVDAVQARGAQAVVDARGAALRSALGARPLVVKLNRAELQETTGAACGSDDEVRDGARALHGLGAQRVIVTLGPDGALATDGPTTWRVTHPAESGNPIGAGDAFSAGVAVALADGRPFAEALGDGAAAALASLRFPTAGHVVTSDLVAARQRVTTTIVPTGD